MARSTLCFAVALTACLGTQALRADLIHMKNGDRLTGHLVRSDAKVLNLRTEYAGTISLALDAIEQVSAEQPVYVTLNDGQVLLGPLTTEGDRLKVATKTGGTISVARSAVQTMRSEEEQRVFQTEWDRLRNPGLLDLWSGFVDSGVSLTSGNAKTTNFTLGVNAARTTRRDKTTAYMTSVYARNTTNGVSATSANARRGGGRYEVNVTDRSVGFGFGDLEFDEFQKLDLRLVLGGGLGWYFVKSERSQFQVFGGAAFNKEYFATNLRRSSGELLAGQEFFHRLSERTQFRERAVVYPNLSESGEFRTAVDVSLVTSLNRWLDWHVTLGDRYLTNPVQGAQKNDLLLTTGVRVTFKK